MQMSVDTSCPACTQLGRSDPDTLCLQALLCRGNASPYVCKLYFTKCDYWFCSTLSALGSASFL